VCSSDLESSLEEYNQGTARSSENDVFLVNLDNQKVYGFPVENKDLFFHTMNLLVNTAKSKSERDRYEQYLYQQRYVEGFYIPVPVDKFNSDNDFDQYINLVEEKRGAFATDDLRNNYALFQFYHQMRYKTSSEEAIVSQKVINMYYKIKDKLDSLPKKDIWMKESVLDKVAQSFCVIRDYKNALLVLGELKDQFPKDDYNDRYFSVKEDVEKM
jgi:hypothetical protein